MMHINKLPAELLQNIFYKVVFDEVNPKALSEVWRLDGARCTLTSVCSWWRSAAVDHHIIWATVNIPFLSHTRKSSIQWAQLCLQRCNGLGVKLHFAIHYHEYTVSRDEWEAFLSSFTELLRKHLPRITNISFKPALTGMAMYQILSVILLLADLRSMYLRVSSDITSEEAIGPFTYHRNTLASIEELVIKGEPFDRRQLREILAFVPRLRSLRLESGAKTKPLTLGQSIKPSFVTPCLESLELIDVLITPSSFNAPQLKHLHYQPHKLFGREGGVSPRENNVAGWARAAQEFLIEPSFPILTSFSFTANYLESTHLNPACLMLHVHTTISELTVISKGGASEFLRRVFYERVKLEALEPGQEKPPLENMFASVSEPVCPPSLKRVIIDDQESSYGAIRRTEEPHRIICIIHTLLHNFPHLRFEWLQNSGQRILPARSDKNLLLDPNLAVGCRLFKYVREEVRDPSSSLPLAAAQRGLCREFPGRFIVKTFTTRLGIC